MKSKIRRIIKSFPSWILWLVLIIIGIVLVIFNDALGDNEFFALLAISYFLLVFLLIVHWLFTRIKQILKLKNEKVKTELMHLQSQVNPHFFFNTLNNLYGLVDKDNLKARQMILKLSDMMNYSIYKGQKEAVTLGEEVEYLQSYIDLHRMRYHKKIDIKFQYDLGEKEQHVMPLLFIILLENAFKHGVENLTEGAYVHILLTSGTNEIHFEIENNFDATQLPPEAGLGLKNLKRRLELVYPNVHNLSFSKTGNTYKALLTLKMAS